MDVGRLLRASVAGTTPEKLWWHECLWLLIGATCAAKHNLLVLAYATDHNVRVAAAHEVAGMIAAAAYGVLR